MVAHPAATKKHATLAWTTIIWSIKRAGLYAQQDITSQPTTQSVPNAVWIAVHALETLLTAPHAKKGFICIRTNAWVCPGGFYGSSKSNKCEYCHQPCKRCSIFSKDSSCKFSIFSTKLIISGFLPWTA